MSVFGHKPKIPNAAVPSILNSIRVQRSDMGSVVPIIFGQNRIPGKLLWYGDFTPIPHTSTQAVGGKGGGGKKNNQTTTTYTYQAAVAIMLCEGAIQGLYNVWDTKGKLAQQTVTENYTVPGGGGTYTVNQSANYYDDYGVGRTDSYSVNANDYGDIPRTYSGSYRTRMARTVGTPSTGQYSRPATGQYQFAAGDAGKQMSITYQYNVPDSTGTGAPATSLSLTLFLGSLGQSPWSYLSTNHSAQAIGYSNTAYIASQSMDLGSQGSLPNYTYEVIGLFPFGAGITDSNPSDIINCLLTDQRIGVGISSSYVGSLTQYSNYCIANGLFISPVLDSQRPVRDWVQEILDATNSQAFYSEGLIKFVPYGDMTVVGNGVTYTPATSPVFDFTDDNYVNKNNPILIKRTPIQDAFNSVKVEWYNRSNQYNPEPIEEKDDGTINQYGLRPDNPIQYDFITQQAVAAFAANTRLKRNIYIRKTYTFSLGWQFGWVEPMDLVTLTDSKLGLSKVPVRITKVDEDYDNGQIDFEAEEFPFGTATATLYSKQAPTSYNPQSDADPGNVNTPIFYEPPARATQQQGYELWIGVSGGSNWGGCYVYASRDNSSFEQFGYISGPARTGVLSTTLPNTADPDTTDTVGVDLTSSAGSLNSGSAADCDNFVTMCLIDNELISYQTATLTAQYKYNLTTRLRRGVYGSTVASHSIGGKFMRIDQAVLKQSYDPQWIGQTIYFKFVSFNTLGQKLQNIATLSSYSITISGVRGGIDAITGFYTGNLDTINDGTTYQRPLATALTNGAVDIAKPGVVGKAVELIRNYNFESGDRDWDKETGWSIVNDGNAYSGSWAAKWVGSSGAAALRNQIRIACAQNDVVIATAMIKVTAGGGNCYVRISFWNASNVEIADIAGNAVTSSTYANSRVTATAPANTVYCRVECVASFATSATTVYIDEFNGTITLRNADELNDGPTNPLGGGRRGWNALTASYNLVSGQKIGGDSGLPVSGNVFSTSDMYMQNAGTTKFRINNTSSRQWSIASV